MSRIRKAHSVEIIDRRLHDCQVSPCAAMELIGLYDELSRVERKWREKAANPIQPASALTRQRPLANAAQMNNRFDQLARLIGAMLRNPPTDVNERAMLERIVIQLRQRIPL